ncbi:RHS repeat-associated core domain-containing protein [Terriglobus albidus]|uniref:RHS repeat-associated core domain-containing protein n=1 Tax=Terriglobus albidus TaxID=1592106 RepID=UPI00164E2151|nr:RHS repeat-associated core domain-containing protein [Terriglobus albidus]
MLSLLGYSATCFAQYDYLPKVGIKDFATYQQSSIDSVDLDTGNVNLHIPLLGFPQKGSKLRLNFIVRYNEPQWFSAIGMPLYNPTIGGYSAAGFWKLKDFNNPRPLGVDVVRDQAVTSTYNMTPRIAPGCCGNGDPIDYYSEGGGIRDRSGAVHDLWARAGTGGQVAAPLVNFPAPDGSGWVFAAGGLKDKEGVTYSSLTIQSGGVSRPAWNISDAHGNTITTDVDGWHDSMGRIIPGSWGGHGSGSVNSPNGYPPLEDDPFPGVPSSEMARCNNGAVATRTWTVPASSDSGGSQTYYFCFSKYTANTRFNFNGRLGQVNSAVLDEASFDAYLLTKIILPNNTSYSFQYDPDFLDLTRIDLPTGGVVVYTWGTVKWDLCSTAQPMKRVVTARSVTTGGGVSSWSYNWGNNGVCGPQPGDAIPVIVSRPDQNDEWHYQSRIEDNGKLNKYVVSYKGHASGDAYKATGTISKIVKTSSSFRSTPLFTQTQDILVSPETGPDGNPIVKWLPGYSTPETIPGPVETTIMSLYDLTTQKVVSSQETDATPVPSSGTIERWNPDNYWYPAHDTCACVNYTEIATEKVYDFVQGAGSGPGTLLRKTDMTYRFQDTGGADYENNGLTGLPSQIKIYDGGSHQVAQTGYTYDDSTYSAGVVAGEVTSVRKWKDASNHIDTYSSFNSDGTWTGSVDANGIKTHVDSFDCSSAFPKSVTKAYGTSIAETSVYSHDCNTGKVTSHKDANSQTTSYTYADSLNRVTAVDYPDGGHTAITYTDGANSSAKVQVDTGGTQGKMSQTVSYDLVGRTIKVQQNAGSDVISVDTKYDDMGHVYSTSNPYTDTQGSSSSVTVNTYDELERPIQKTNPDGSSQTFSYSGNVVTTKDEIGNAWKRTSDALGELTNVEEPNGAKTAYTYTARGDLATVSQAGLSGETARARSFDYDWLSRLSQSYNPESGWICYGATSSGAASGSNCTADYDGNGNLGHKTDSRGVVTSYSYDAFNRLTLKHANDGITPDVGYYYDQTSNWGGTVANGIGRLGQVNYAYTNGHYVSETYSYDALGRVVFQFVAPSNAGATWFATTYDLAGNVIGYGRSSGPTIERTYDSASRLQKVTLTGYDGIPLSYDYLKSASYFPDGSVQSMTFGNNVTESYTRNSRLQINGFKVTGPSSAGSPVWLNRSYDYLAECSGTSHKNNGNIYQISDQQNSSRSQCFTYDSLNRISSYLRGSTGGFNGGQTYSFDSFGNASQTNSVGPNLVDFAPGFDAKNRIAASAFGCDAVPGTIGVDPANSGYDLSGNMLCTGARNYTAKGFVFNASGQVARLYSQLGSNTYAQTEEYLYNADGNRVHKGSGSDWTDYAYVNGQMLTEFHPDGVSDYVYANGQKIARADSYDQRIHIHGNRCDPNNCGWQSATWHFPVPAYTIKAGDKVTWRQYQAGGAIGGLTLSFNNGANTNWTSTDTDGQVMNNLTSHYTWVTRTVDLSSFANTVLGDGWIVAEGQTAAGDWDEWFGEIAIYSTDGTVTPIYNRLRSIGLSYYGTPGMTNVQANVEHSNSDGDASFPRANTTYYAADHLGSATMEFSAGGVNGPGGWPMWRGEYAPYGQELTASIPTVNNYKFTGKERDLESGLDYFGARYYGSTMGRWMSPDWSRVPTAIPFATLDNPQSLNLYNYVGNNPITKRDPDGHHQECAPDNSTLDPQTGVLTVHAGRCHEVDDLPWWLAFNPWGKLGSPRHRQSVRQLAKLLRSEGYEVQTEVKVDTPQGAKASRFVDVVGVKPRTGETKMYQVGEANKDGSPVARERSALNDIEKATGIRPQFEDKGVGARLEAIESGQVSLRTPIEEEGEGAGRIGGEEPEIPIDIP